MGLFKRKKEEIGESIRHLKSSTPIEITLEYNDEIKYFYSKLVYILSEKEIIIVPPRSIRGNIVKLSEKYKYKIRLKTTKGLFENVMSIKSYEIEDGVPMLKIKLLEPTKKIQRREGFRLNIKLDFTFIIIEELDKNDLKKQENLIFQGKTIDISSGGLKFIANKDMNIDDKIKILLNIKGVIVVALATIIYKAQIENKDGYNFSYKCRFVNIPQKYKEDISKYIFNVQRELSKIGKILKE